MYDGFKDLDTYALLDGDKLPYAYITLKPEGDIDDALVEFKKSHVRLLSIICRWTRNSTANSAMPPDMNGLTARNGGSNMWMQMKICTTDDNHGHRTEAYDIDWKESREAERAFNLAFDIREIEGELAELRATI